VKTVAGGKFTYTVAAKTVGTNNVTVSYNGNKNYNGVSAKKTFKVYKQGLKITVNKITGTKYKNTVKVTGKLTDANGKVIMNTLVTININGKAYTAKTNNKGVYTLTLKATSIGVNNVSVSYKGNKNYKKATAKTTFKVAKQNVKVTLTSSNYSNAKATITGKLVDANNKVLMNSNVKITINNKTYTAKTNTEGTYTITKPVTTKKISLTLAYNGNNNYNSYKKISNVTLA
ncbi:MAG: Ig-like domain repeat protein, partial [Methanosphaera sp.]|nr:Ig-like domain repeat protein [Methanosphaera sp.]